MNGITAGYEELIARFTRWVQAEENIRAAFIFGSRARRDHPADEWSDLDLLFLTETPQIYVEDTEWLQQIGEPWINFLDRTPDGGYERRVLFKGGLDVDFIPDSVSGFRKILAEGRPSILMDIFRRGYHVLVDKDGLMELFRWLAVETAGILSFAYPANGDERCTELVKQLFSTRAENRA